MTVNITFRGSGAIAPTSTTIKGIPLTNAEIDGNFSSVKTAIEQIQTQANSDQTFSGVKTFNNQIIASGGVTGNLTGNATSVTNGVYTVGNQSISGVKTFNNEIIASGGVSGNATSVTNGVYTVGDQTIGGVKTFSSRVVGKTSGTDENGSFVGQSTGGAYATMWTRRGAVVRSNATTVGSNYAPALSHIYTHNTSAQGVYSIGALNNNAATAGAFAIHHLSSAGTQDYAWTFSGVNGDFTSPGNVTAFSDISLKTDLRLIADALEKVSRLNGYTYTRIDTGERNTGVVAQEVQQVLPEAVVDNNGILSVAYGNMMGLLIEAVKELTVRVEKLEGQ
jgi:hypothetical protein